MRRIRVELLLLTATLLVAAACHRTPPVAKPTPPPPQPFPSAAPAPAPAPPTPVPEPPPVPMEPPVNADPLTNRAIDDINKNSPLKPVFFAYDSDELDDA